MRYCLNCNKEIIKGSGRQKYCSSECSDDFWAKHNWQILKDRFIKKNGYRCKHCGKMLRYSTGDDWLIVDHIKPIRLDGPEFDENNLQVLCRNCNRIKTANDMGDIAKKRKDERILSDNQAQLFDFSNQI
jgi:5-methylcytosine-specific restriction endonuclease McrA